MTVAELEAIVGLDDFSIVTHNGCVTMTNPATGNHQTVWIRTQSKDAEFMPNGRLVHLFNGTENNNLRHYKSFGVINSNGQIVLWKKHRDDKFYLVLCKMLENPKVWAEHRGVEYLIEGRCRHCNIKLTNPVSVKTGLGPICGKR